MGALPLSAGYPARRSLWSRGPTQDPSSAPARGPAQTSLPAGGRERREAPPERPWELRSLVAQELVLPGGKPRVGASPCRVCGDRVAAPVRARSPVRVVSPSAGHAPGPVCTLRGGCCEPQRSSSRVPTGLRPAPVVFSLRDVRSRLSGLALVTWMSPLPVPGLSL